MPVSLRFERGRDGVIGPTYGPYDYVQITYTIIRIPGDRDIAFRELKGDWIVCDGGPNDGCHYSDIIIYEDKP